MGALLSCYGKKEKTKDQYYHEIFDGLDIDGTQTLDAKELQTLWEKVKQQKLVLLNKQLNDFIMNKQQEISDTNNFIVTYTNDKFDIKEFIKIMKILIRMKK